MTAYADSENEAARQSPAGEDDTATDIVDVRPDEAALCGLESGARAQRGYRERKKE